ncbi:MAG TPA: YIP1 family protein [Methanocorpusculum sp.]|nr:YIP1 family protein [Methanocorpusculum sp.]HJK80397.1 YIP1 family protein [Methanocorpusculum sp.]
MTFAADILSLLFHPKEFFADASRTQSLKLPLIYTAVYGIFAAVVAYQVSAASAALIGMPDAAGVLGAVGAVTGFIMAFLIWVIVAAFFFVFVKFITHTTAGFKTFLSVTGYASLPILIGTVLMLLAGAVSPGIFDGWTGYLLNLVVLFWCMPIWIYGFAAAGNVPVRAVFTALLIPIIIMAAYTAYETYTTIESLKTLAATGGMNGMQISMQPPR